MAESVTRLRMAGIFICPVCGSQLELAATSAWVGGSPKNDHLSKLADEFGRVLICDCGRGFALPVVETTTLTN